MEYYLFTENNDWEGEIWNFYIPMTKAHRDAIENLIQSTDEYDCPYTISNFTYTENEVDVIVENAEDEGYMPSDIKCEPINPRLVELFPVLDITQNDPFYKGACWTDEDFNVEFGEDGDEDE